ncbi:hypothetical protein [Litoribacter populi]|uniref:hypothetical protein n=1 Tax=Litoribacter populi TaxID=2598460 RepID=UPI001F321A13|nr:hypothetical protein [Litoribacter populi]
MMKVTTKLPGLLIVLFSFLAITAEAQEDYFGIDTKARKPKSHTGFGNAARNVLSSISLDVAGGYGYHFHKLDFISTDYLAYPISYLGEESAPGIGMGEEVSFRGSNIALPVNAAVKIDLFGIATIGGGVAREWGRMNAPTFGDYAFNYATHAYVFDKLYGSVGIIIYDARKRASFLNWRYRKYSGSNTYMQAERKLRLRQHYPWRFILEGEAGQIMIRESFDPNLVSVDPFYGVGVRIERDLSDYVKVYAKPNFEVRRMELQHPTLEESQIFSQQLFTLNAGISLRLPGTKRCKVSGCGVKMKHIHDGVEYRGSSIFNMQNRKIGQW